MYSVKKEYNFIGQLELLLFFFFLNFIETTIFSSFDTEFRVWESLQSMPYKVRNYQAVVLNGKIYVVGGLIANAIYSNRFCCYDPNTDTWTEMTQANFEMSGLVLFKWQDSIYAASSDVILRKYNHENNVWDVVYLNAQRKRF